MKTNGNGKHPTPRKERVAPAKIERDSLDVVDAWGLDFHTGNAVRFILEADDGLRMQNLETARSYLDRAIARCGA